VSRFERIMHVVVFALAVSRLSRLLTDDYITAPLRKRMKESGNEHLSYLAGCPACSSFWAAVIALVLPRKLLVVLAASEATVLLRLLEPEDDDDEEDAESSWRSD
jgi:hypothetical protein